MKKYSLKLFFLSLLFFMTLCCWAKESVVIDGVLYTLHGNGTKGTLSIKVKDKNSLPSNLVIPSGVIVNNREYPVTEIEANGFENCKNLVTLTLPNTINKIGKLAFYRCTSLKNAILPDEAKAVIYKGDYGFNGGGIFKGCTSLQDVRGILIPYPQYIVYEAIWECPEVPFYQTIEKNGAVTMSRKTKSVSFSDYALDRVKDPIEQWQKRKDYETLAQWEVRVTDSNRSKLIQEYLTEAKTNFIRDNAPLSISGIIDSYNNDFNFFIISTPNMGNLYVSVPFKDKELFESNWNKVELEPNFGILDNEIAILDCKFILDGKQYDSARKYEEDDLMQLTVNITPLSALREYEQTMANVQEGRNDTFKHFEPDIIDIEIPITSQSNDKTFAVIIGNEDYQRVAPVDYAMNDARIFEKYCERTLGIPQKNIRTYYNATYGDIVAAMEDITNISEAYKGDINIIFYYAGHGLPDEGNRNAYILPIDASGTQLETCYPMDKLYQQLGDLNVNSVVAFLDACFSGSLRGDGMLASARGIKLKPKDITVSGKMVVLSASSADQSAYPYHEKNHGLFTYYLLKKLQESKGEISMGELADYVSEEVAKTSIIENKKPQNPNIKFSMDITDSWRNIILK